mmetsp:Transcript_18919/g.40964  ORF Transcript_18919/g.40964 Transcript_18919/m.40964 type:complete len:203 (+) Transcript_18919:54-662(+)
MSSTSERNVKTAGIDIKASIKYWIFDIMVLSIIISTGRSLFTNPSEAGVVVDLEEVVNKNNQESMPNKHRTQTQTFQVGDLVLVYAPEINQLAFPARVAKVVRSHDGTTMNYDVQQGFAGRIYTVDSTKLRVPIPFEDNTPAICEFDQGQFVSCVVVSKEDVGPNPFGGLYAVSYKRNGAVEFAVRPYLSIQRIVDTEKTEL